MLFSYHRVTSLACVLVLCFLIQFPKAAYAEIVSFCWQPNQESNLAGYRIYYGTSSGSYSSVIDVGNPPVQTDGLVYGQVENLVVGTAYYFAATAYSIEGYESDYTEEIIWHSDPPLALDDPPLALDSSVSGDEDASISGTLSVDNTNGLSMQFSIQSNPVSGALTVDDGSGQFIYDPFSDFNGQDTFSFIATNTNGSSNTATVTINVTPVNDAPVAREASVTTSEDNSVSGQLSAGDIDGDALSYTVSTQPNYGSVIVGQSGSFTYSPNEDWHGTDTFTFSVHDGTVSSYPATVTINVTSINDAPVAHDASVTTSEDNLITGQLVASDKDEDTITFSLAGQAGNGSLIVDSSGTFTYVPDKNWYGTDTFTFTAFDGVVSSNSATVTINVAPVNDAPVANSQSISVEAGAAVSGLLTAVDIEGDTLTYKVNQVSSQGTVLINTDGSFSYTANQDASGSDVFSFTASDGSSSSQPATVSITITELNPALSFEIIELQVNSDWQYVNFTKSFTSPVVIAKALSFNDNETGVVRVKNITNSGLELRYQEWDSLDDIHAEEVITLIIADAGTYTLENGAKVEAGCFQISGADTFTSFAFQQGMTTVPIVVAAVNSVNEGDAVTLRLNNISENGFEFMMQEQEANSPLHAQESVCYMAWEPSMGSIGTIQFEVARTATQITNNDVSINYGSRFVETPFILANLQTSNDMDTAVLRIRNTTLQELNMFVSEEQSIDLETEHYPETGGYLAFALYDPTGDPDNDGLRTEDEDAIYGTHPGIADTDQDGIDDGDEISLWQSLDSIWSADIDQDGLVNILDSDADGDGVNDGEEVTAGYDPANPYDQGISEFILGVETYKIKGDKYAELTWAGATTGDTDIYRNGNLIFSVANNETYTHGPFNSGKPATYKVCEPGTTRCSNEVTVSW